MSVNILVVDDSATDRLIIKSLLPEYNVRLASSGQEALQIISRHTNLDIIILDLNMPDMDGFALLRVLRAEERYNRLRTIILTNYDEVENEIKGLKMGAVDYIRKPIHMESLKARIETHAELLRIQRMLEDKLYETELTYNGVFHQAPIGIAISRNNEPYITGSKGNTNVVSINPAFEQITGRTIGDLSTMGWAEITHPDDLEAESPLFHKLTAGGNSNYSIEKRLIRPDGSLVWVNAVVARLTEAPEGKFAYLCLLQDITGRKEMEDTLKYSSEHDMWTGLYNRRYLENLLKKESLAKEEGKRALVSINLTAVSTLSLTNGFHYSQELIKKAAESLDELSSQKHQLFSAYENRFVFYVKEYVDKRDLRVFFEEVTVKLEALFSMERISIGIGVIEITEDNKQDVNLLLKNLLIASEKALSTVETDIGICYFDCEMEALIKREETIKYELSEIASGKESAKLFLEYQPIVDLKTDKICGFEALARLNSEKLGLVMPGEFIPLAERTKLIIPLGEIILHQAFGFLNRLKEKGMEHLGISINISGIQLLRRGFGEKLFELIEETGVNPANISIEITETVFVSNYQGINGILSRLLELGVNIAIDDFGTEYSSLARERELNVTCLKIDRYFVDKLLQIDPEQAITGDIISMAHKLGHCVIAEGVEDEEQLNYLRKHDCDRFQGFLFSKPLSEEDAFRRLAEDF